MPLGVTYSASQQQLAEAIVDEMIRRGVGSGGGSGGGGTGDASALNQTSQITLETAIRDRLIELAGYTDNLESLLAALNGYVDSLEGTSATLLSRTPALGSATSAAATPVVLSSDGPFATNFGLTDSAAAATDTGNANLLALLKRLLAIKLPSALMGDRFKTDSLVRSVLRKWREDFAGAQLNPAVWSVLQTGAGQTVSVANSVLSISSGTTANSETIIRSTEKFTISFRTWFIANLSQRIINQEFYLEIVDASGEHYASWLFDGVVNNAARHLSGNSGNSLGSTLLTIIPTATYQIFEIESFPDEVNFFIRAFDSILARNGQAASRTRQIPDPNLEYFVQIRVKNLAIAPASPTTLNIDAITVQDIEELTTEITGGRGGSNANQAIPTNVVNPVTISGNISTAIASGADSFISFTDFASPFAANQSTNGTARDTSSQRNTVRGSLLTDQLGTITIEQSTDAATFIQTHVFTPGSIPSTQAYLFNFLIYRRYYRIKYTNGATASTTMSLTTSMFAVGSS